EDAPPPPTASELSAAKALAAAKAGPVGLGAPLPAPVESTTPPAYETPGLSKATVEADGKIVLHGLPKPIDAVSDPPAPSQLAAVFTPKGAIYGAPQGERSIVTVQALKSSLLMVRGADGSLYFARQLAAGEAFRAPQVEGLT